MFHQVCDGGGRAANAKQIQAALDANPTLGSVNVAIDLDRELEPGKGNDPSPFKGIDGIYHRQYEHDASGRCTHVLLQQHFGLGEGKRVPMSAMRELWKDPSLLERMSAQLQPATMQPQGGERETSAKRKLSEEAEKQLKLERKAKRNRKWQMQYCRVLKAAAAERAFQAKVTIHSCQFKAQGCKHCPFLTARGAKDHAARQCFFNPKHTAHQRVSRCHVEVKVQPEEAMRKKAQRGRIAWLRLSVAAGGAVCARVVPREAAERKQPMWVRFKLHEPLKPGVGEAKGLQPF